MDTNHQTQNPPNHPTYFFSMQQAAKAGKVAALLALIWVGISLLTSMYDFLSYLSYYGEVISSLMIRVLYMASTGLFIIPIIGIFKFASKINSGVITGNNLDLETGFQALKKASTWVFILAIAKLGLWFISTVISELGAF